MVIERKKRSERIKRKQKEDGEGCRHVGGVFSREFSRTFIVRYFLLFRHSAPVLSGSPLIHRAAGARHVVGSVKCCVIIYVEDTPRYGKIVEMRVWVRDLRRNLGLRFRFGPEYEI